MRNFISIISIIIYTSTYAQTHFEVFAIDKNLLLTQPNEPWGNGVSAEDFDKDGDIDLFISSAAPFPNQLLVNQGSGIFDTINFHKKWNTTASLWFDYDGDKLLDLFIAGNCPYGTHECQTGAYWQLFKQSYSGEFLDVTRKAGLSNFSRLQFNELGGLSAGDINLDGYLDLVITYWQGAPLIVFLNKGDGSFVDASHLIDSRNQALYQPLIHDLDLDGRPDVYLTTDFSSPNQLWKQSGNLQFKDIAPEIGLNSNCDDMGLSLGDIENDGDLDLHITCIGRGVLLVNDGFNFTNRAMENGISESGFDWGTTFLDADNDGNQDLAVTNGGLNSGINEGSADQSRFWYNLGNGSFEDRSHQVGFNDLYRATTLISADINCDGDLDLIQMLKSGEDAVIKILDNKLEQHSKRNFLVIRPRMQGTNHWAIGSVVRIYSGENVQTRPITAGISFYGQEPAEAFFGLGDKQKVDKVEIIWPGGGKTERFDVTANQVITISDAQVLHPPHLVNINYGAEGSLEVVWKNRSTTSSNFILEYATEDEFSDPILMEIGYPSASKKINNLDPFQEYFFRIRAVKDGEETITSNVLSAFAPGVTLIPPEDLFLENIELGRVRLNWEDISFNESGYEVQRSLSATFDDYLIFNLPANSRSMIHENLQPGFTYYFRIRSTGKDWASEFSKTISMHINEHKKNHSHIILNSESSVPFTIFPNPTISNFEIQGLEGPFMITFQTLSGKLIQTNLFHDKVINHHLKSGLYFITILDRKNNLYQKKLIVR